VKARLHLSLRAAKTSPMSPLPSPTMKDRRKKAVGAEATESVRLYVVVVVVFVVVVFVVVVFVAKLCQKNRQLHQRPLRFLFSGGKTNSKSLHLYKSERKLRMRKSVLLRASNTSKDRRAHFVALGGSSSHSARSISSASSLREERREFPTARRVMGNVVAALASSFLQLEGFRPCREAGGWMFRPPGEVNAR